jgi:hypothetical protein
LIGDALQSYQFCGFDRNYESLALRVHYVSRHFQSKDVETGGLSGEYVTLV